MSHWTEIKTQIKDPEALRAAVAELGLTLEPNAMARGYNGNEVRAEFVIKCKGPYDIAVNKEPNGCYGFKTDWWQGHVAREVGQNFQKLIQLYGVHKATIEARRKGLTVQRTLQANGSVKLVIAGMR